MKALAQFIKTHRRLLMLKLIIAIAMIVNHFWPSNEASVIINLIWLMFF